MIDRRLEPLVEALLSPHRHRDDQGRLVPPAEWWDLPVEGLDEAYRRSFAAREVERALDPRGRSGTVRAVMARLRSG